MSDTAYAPAGAKKRKTVGIEVQGETITSLQRPQPKPVPAPEPAYQTPPVEDEIGKRIEEMRALRRERKPQDISGFSQKLSVPQDLKDPRLEYRWVNDTDMRHHDMQKKGWIYADNAIVAKDERNSGTGSRIERIANERTTPKPQKTFLMVKPREFYEEDKKAELAQIKAHEQAIQRADAVRNQQGGSEPGMYIPSGGMKIEHGR